MIKSFSTLCALGVFVVLVNCSGDVLPCEDTKTCSSAGPGDAGGDVVLPAGCDLSADPKNSPTCVDDGVGIFVSPTGDDLAIGSRAKPVKTISKGISLASAKSLPRVYVCEGTYEESLVLTPEFS